MKRQTIGLGGCVIAGLGMLALGLNVNAQQVEPVLETSRGAVQDTSRSQDRVDQLDTRTQTLLGDYRANLRQLEQLNRYNASQQRQVEAQRNEIASLTRDIENIASLQRAVQPLMEDMVEALANLVEADMPFLQEERRERVERLRGIMDDPSRSPAQRYRLVVEAYQIENEYGRTIESYRDDIEVGGRVYENVDFLRIGRAALTFRTDDDQVLKRYDAESRQWVDLDKSFLPHIKTGTRIAREQIPPDLMFIPVTAPQSAN
jgi:hypothetical protein